MSDRFPHLHDSQFPNAGNIDVYKYKNEIDYSRFDFSQMEICVCTVPWDMGEAHIGARTIDGIGNVVYFGTKEKRDAWFDAIPDSQCFRWETKYRELHTDEIMVPLPFDIAARYNYVYVRYHLVANDSSTLEYEKDGGLREWFYFIRSVEMVAPNSTKLVLMPDAWQTFIYDVTISNMILERGHAPMFATRADAYLENPIENSENLLTEDVNYGELQRVSSINAVDLNSEDMYACFVLSCNPWNDWGDNETDIGTEGKTPWRNAGTGNHITWGGVPNYRVVALPATELNSFFDDVTEQVPQFKQNIKCVFFCAKKYLTFSKQAELVNDDGSFTLAGHTLYDCSGGPVALDELLKISKDKFNYPSQYADIAKLYTFPYAAIELTDEKGNSTLVHIEDTTGTLNLRSRANIVFPYINITGNIEGIGGNKSVTLSFQHITERSFKFSGRWYQYVQEWNIPTFAVMVSARARNNYDEFFDREQKKAELANARKIAKANANVAKSNSYASAEAARDNAYDSADTAQTNTNADASTAQTNANASASTTQTNTNASADTTQSTTKASADTVLKNERRETGFMDDMNKGETSINWLYNNKVTTRNNTFIDTQSAKPANYDGANSVGYGNHHADDLLTPTSYGLNNGKLLIDTEQSIGLSIAANNITTDATAATSVISGVTGAVQGVGGGLVGGGTYGGAVGAAIGAGTGLVGGIINGASTQAQAMVTITKDNAVTTAQTTVAQINADTAISYNVAMSMAQKTYNADMTQYRNQLTNDENEKRTDYLDQNADATKTTADSNADAVNTTTKANATREYNTATANATRDYDTATANAARTRTTARGNAKRTYDAATGNADRSKTRADENADNTYDVGIDGISRRRHQIWLEPASEYGNVANAETATTRPMTMFANVVTESENAIANAGDEFLRYGYTFNRYWNFDGNWNVGKHFTYWKLRDFWVSDLSTPDEYMDRLRFFLFGGVTVWSNPEEIGKVTIYENY